VKHAGAGAVRVRSGSADGVLELSIRDDGSGFDPVASTMGAGLGNIRDRVESLAGWLTLTSTPGAGTMVSAPIPAVPVDYPQREDRSAHAAR